MENGDIFFFFVNVEFTDFGRSRTTHSFFPSVSVFVVSHRIPTRVGGPPVDPSPPGLFGHKGLFILTSYGYYIYIWLIIA